MAAKKTRKKRAEKYESKLALKEGTEWDSLIAMSLKPQPAEKKQAPKAKRAKGKKK